MIKDFFIFCSGADKEILRQCPTENIKFISIGANIFISSVLASISAGYAILFIINDLFISFAIGIAWGFAVFHLDRFIILSIKRNSSAWNEFIKALPRILIAAVLSIIISKPLELKLFDKSITEKTIEIQSASNGDKDNRGYRGSNIDKVNPQGDFLLRLQAFNKLKRTENSVWWTSMLLSSLFLLITSTPVILKFISKKGPYDEIIERIEYEIHIKQQEIIAEKNDKINNALAELQEIYKLRHELRIKTEKAKIESELKINETIVNKLSKRQVDLANISIEKWYNEEILNLANKFRKQYDQIKQDIVVDDLESKVLPDSREVSIALEEIKRQLKVSFTETLDG